MKVYVIMYNDSAFELTSIYKIYESKSSAEKELERLNKDLQETDFISYFIREHYVILEGAEC